MKKVVLLHQDEILHYRVSVYNALCLYLNSRDIYLSVISGGIDPNNPHSVQFPCYLIDMKYHNICSHLLKDKPDAVILFVNLKNLYLFPVILFLKRHGIKVIYWGHGIDQGDKKSIFKNALYAMEHRLSDAIILYSEDLKKYVSSRLYSRVFVANNTLNISGEVVPDVDRKQVLAKNNISTTKNILFVGRLQKHKKGLEFLLDAHDRIKANDVGLIICGSNFDFDLNELERENVFYLGPLFGNEFAEIMVSADLYCLPKWVGLSIVDAFFYGLPLITTDVDHPPEIMYLKHNENGLILPQGDVETYAREVMDLLRDDVRRCAMSRSAKATIEQKASIDGMCKGFLDAIKSVI